MIMAIIQRLMHLEVTN